MLAPYTVNCGGSKVIPPDCGFAEWGSIVGDPGDNASLSVYLTNNFISADPILTDFSNLISNANVGDLFYINGAGDLTTIPLGSGTQFLGVYGGLPQYKDLPGGGPISGATNLDELSDVDLDVLSVGDILRYDGANFVNVTPDVAVSGAETGDLSDVAINTPTTGDVFWWDGTQFVNYSFHSAFMAEIGASNLDELSDVEYLTPPTPGEILAYNNVAGTGKWVNKPYPSTSNIPNGSTVPGALLDYSLDYLYGMEQVAVINGTTGAKTWGSSAVTSTKVDDGQYEVSHTLGGNVVAVASINFVPQVTPMGVAVRFLSSTTFYVRTYEITNPSKLEDSDFSIHIRRY